MVMHDGQDLFVRFCLLPFSPENTIDNIENMTLSLAPSHDYVRDCFLSTSLDIYWNCMAIREVKVLRDLHVILDIFYRLKDHHKTKTDLDGSKTDHCSPAFTVIFGLQVWLGDYFNTTFGRYKKLMSLQIVKNCILSL